MNEKLSRDPSDSHTLAANVPEQPGDTSGRQGESLADEQAHWLDPAVIMAHLRTAGDVVPDPVAEEVFGRVIQSAEGVTTFAGYAASRGARERVQAKLDRISDVGPAPTDVNERPPPSWE